ncbi:MULTISPECIES: carbohydrate ABC transporter permease [Paenibacillus]|uniref:Sugar ABC transporter ATP-binding protein n=2 Tax=Paenibacillus TaxID=44249 RepID=A0A081P097_9BACL|nr:MULTISPECIES: carbohydrate ABC transporter permease [Paenibacillus]KEQ24120.1 sugar ABC transporter ATP-binding protein [Paenibacillus tyrfis]KZE78497.1 sugar ABC transporter ATP-binding protein [Paenibacillus elgii]MCM3267711.1 carbohydrate ABC transporter permease [Paenibacillus elgii]MCP1312461.1 carbohydrate ABC transporter permease [Paenibacillus tyrfis]NEN80953.1 carbohydrate ABC transporter permease [Paenibacillus elgii]
MPVRKFDLTKWLLTILLGAFSVLFLVPLIWMISAASKFEKDVMEFPIRWIPKDWNFIGNFQEVWLGKVPFYLFYLNSLKLALIMTACTIFFSSMAAFAFTKLRFKGRDLAFGMLLTFMVIPEQATLVPRYLLMKWLHLYNTHAGMVLMGMFSIYFTFLLRQFMMGIHSDFIEAARIDGAGYFKTYWSIILPLCKPILATVGIIKFIWTWNDYQTPLIFLINKGLYTIPLGMQMFKDEFADNYAVIMMASLSAILPLLIIFVVLQKQVINGISLGGVKG